MRAEHADRLAGLHEQRLVVLERSAARATMASNAGQLRAALPEPPYTTRSSGRSATSGSRLFISIRSAASCGQPLQESVVPRGARTRREVTGIAFNDQRISANERRREPAGEVSTLKNVASGCQQLTRAWQPRKRPATYREAVSPCVVHTFLHTIPRHARRIASTPWDFRSSTTACSFSTSPASRRSARASAARSTRSPTTSSARATSAGG